MIPHDGVIGDLILRAFINFANNHIANVERAHYCKSLVVSHWLPHHLVMLLLHYLVILFIMALRVNIETNVFFNKIKT